MIYVLPKWNSTVPIIPEFDNSVKQIQLFTEASSDKVSVLSLSFASQTKRELEDNDLENTPVFSMFNTLQRALYVDEQRIDINDFNWPKGLKIIEGDPLYYVYKNQVELYAKVWLHKKDYSFLNVIDFYENNRRTHRYEFDDRGFLSRKIFYTDDQITPTEELYFAPDQQIVMNHKIVDGRSSEITLENEFNGKNKFISLVDLQTEYLLNLSSDLENINNELIVEYSKDNHEIIKKSNLQKISKYLSFNNFNNLIQQINSDEIAEWKNIYNKIIVPNPKQKTELINLYPDLKEHVIDISPYPMHIKMYDLSLDAQEDKKNILWVSQSDEDKNAIIEQFNKMLASDQEISLTILPINEFPQENMNLFDIQHRTKVKIDFNQSESNIVKLIASSRIVVDMAKYPNQFIQSKTLEAGLPQIVLTITEYNREEGSYIQSTNENLAENILGVTSDVKKWVQMRQRAMFSVKGFLSVEVMNRWNQVFNQEI
ncbi:MAG: accessory Sec system glycosyltransferase Asp1 [Lactobacillaceae bacterium]|jgi:accessory secretory protein Asp1|nr:accessory Sec system glycosyltransferase Asp1 [Lactobacillaceae bacterium]